MLYRLFLKGPLSPIQARNVCLDHGIHAGIAVSEGPDNRLGTVIMDAEISHDTVGRLAEWFCEGPVNPPYPPGTLLFYNLEKGQGAL